MKKERKDFKGEAKITEVVKGKIIKSITYDNETKKEPNLDNEKEFENDDENIYINFEDGTTLIMWNSEWGGIDFDDEG